MIYIKMSDERKSVTVKAERIEIEGITLTFYYGEMEWITPIWQMDAIWYEEEEEEEKCEEVEGE